MALFQRMYFNAVFGGLGGLLGWLLVAVFCERTSASPTEQIVQNLIKGAFIGGAIGYFVVSVEAIRDRSLLRFVRLASYGLVLGAFGGAIGIVIGDWINTLLVARLGATSRGRGVFVATLLARGLGWGLLGLAIGLSEGIAARSAGKISYGILGGTLGGLMGGVLFALAYLLMADQAAASAIWGCLGLVILGATIGSLSALVQGVLQPASLRVLRGWQEGREYPLDKKQNQLGRDEHADIALFRDMKVEKRHASIEREGQRYILKNRGAPATTTLVNNEPVPDRKELRDGDRIQLGNVLLRFQTRVAQKRRRTNRPVNG